MKLLYLALAVLFASTTDSSAAAVFDTVRNKSKDLFENVKTVVFVVGGFGLVGLAVGAIFGAVKWKWFASLAFGLLILAIAAQIVNYSSADSRRVEIAVSASYNAPTQKVLDALVQAGTVDNVLLEPAPTAVITGYGDSAIGYSLRIWVKPDNYWDVYFLVMQRVKEMFDQQGIEMTYPHLNVHLDK